MIEVGTSASAGRGSPAGGAVRGRTDSAPVGPAPSLLSLAALRFPAAFLVFGFHLHVMGLVDSGATGTALDWVFSQGAGGFSFFFILSGLVLTWSVRPADSPARFWRRRFARIFPNHAVTWLIALAFIVLNGAAVRPGVVLPNLLLVQAWLPDPRVFFGMNIVSWSLACEFFFYLLFPLLHRALVRLPGRALWPAVCCAFAVVWTVPLAAQLVAPDRRYWFIWVFPLARLPEFAIGMLVARIVRDGRWPAFVTTGRAGLLAGCVYVGSRWLPTDLRLVAALSVPLALLVGATMAGDVAGRPARWRWRWLLVLGELSYAFYLVHSLALRLVLHFTGTSNPMPVEVGTAAVSLVLALGASWLLYRFVERPARRLLRPKPAASAMPSGRAAA